MRFPCSFYAIDSLKTKFIMAFDIYIRSIEIYYEQIITERQG